MISLFVIFLSALSCVTFGVLYIDEYKVDSNPEIVKKHNLEIFSDRIHPLSGNFTIETIATVNKFKVYFFLNTPENENDREFRKVIFNTVIDCEKFFKGVYANPFVEYVVTSILKSAQFKPQMPMKPDVYRFVNITPADPPFPINQMNSTGVLNLRFVASVDGKKNGVFIANLWLRGSHMR